MERRLIQQRSVRSRRLDRHEKRPRMYSFPPLTILGLLVAILLSLPFGCTHPSTDRSWEKSLSKREVSSRSAALHDMADYLFPVGKDHPDQRLIDLIVDTVIEDRRPAVVEMGVESLRRGLQERAPEELSDVYDRLGERMDLDNRWLVSVRLFEEVPAARMFIVDEYDAASPEQKRYLQRFLIAAAAAVEDGESPQWYSAAMNLARKGLDDPDWFVRFGACALLAEIGTEEAGRVLREHLKREPDERIRSAIQEQMTGG